MDGRTRARRRRGPLLAGLAAAPAVAATHTPDTTAPRRGTLVSLTPVLSRDATGVRTFPAGRDIATDTVRYGVTGYRLTYRTVDPYGKPTTATGLLALPADFDTVRR
ncbi:hypothetical protein AB0N14_31865 [Streptomyces sp. NPDC051104]|uniref:hypothetical protein n=1 Tax=Streptomyces sp. NPDC051104 TaxID=3155044 RepID=UPI0034355F80